jgi:hypothetical protein
MSETWVVTIEMVAIDGPATVLSLNGEGTLKPKDGTAQQIRLGDQIDLGSRVTLAASSQLTLQFIDGLTETFLAPPDKDEHLAFHPRAHLERRVEDFWEDQLRGYQELRERLEAGLLSEADLQMVPVLGARMSLETALELIAAQSSSPIPRDLAERLEVLPLGGLNAALVVAAEEWTVEKCIHVIRTLQRPISPALMSREDFAVLRQRVYS